MSEAKESEIYEQKYRLGYGHHYPESHIIRIYERFLKQRFANGSQLKVLDFGCGTGANLIFFKDKGFDVYGCDVSPTAIDICKRNKAFNKNQFAVCNEIPNLVDLFGSTRFDLILSNQTLYYLNDELLDQFTEQAYALTNPGGFIVTTMMAKSHWFFSKIFSEGNSLQKVDLSNTRFNQLSLINFKEKEDLEELFIPFQKCLIGFYTLDMLPEEGPSDHWIYIGEKNLHAS